MLCNGTDFSVRKRLCIVTIKSSYMFLIVLSGNDCPKSLEKQALFQWLPRSYPIMGAAAALVYLLGVPLPLGYEPMPIFNQLEKALGS